MSEYGDGQADFFEWQLYVPEELYVLGLRHGLEPLVTVASRRSGRRCNSSSSAPPDAERAPA